MVEGANQKTAMVILTMRLAARRTPVGVMVTVKVQPFPATGAWQLESEIESSTVLLRSLIGPGRGSEKTL